MRAAGVAACCPAAFDMTWQGNQPAGCCGVCDAGTRCRAKRQSVAKGVAACVGTSVRWWKATASDALAILSICSQGADELRLGEFSFPCAMLTVVCCVLG